jgi:hypothetical protein
MQKVKDVRAAFAELRSKLEKITTLESGQEALLDEVEESIVYSIDEKIAIEYDIYEYKVPIEFEWYLAYPDDPGHLSEEEKEQLDNFIENLPNGECFWELDTDNSYFSHSNDVYRDLGGDVVDAILYVKKVKEEECP